MLYINKMNDFNQLANRIVRVVCFYAFVIYVNKESNTRRRSFN